MFQINSRRPRSPRTTDSAISGLAMLLQRMIPALARRKPAGRLLEYLESLPLTAQSSLALVRLREETLLLGITPQSITLLAKDVEMPSQDHDSESAPADQGRTRP
jgi:flagellar biogenesis protein FliO